MFTIHLAIIPSFSTLNFKLTQLHRLLRNNAKTTSSTNTWRPILNIICRYQEDSATFKAITSRADLIPLLAATFWFSPVLRGGLASKKLYGFLEPLVSRRKPTFLPASFRQFNSCHTLTLFLVVTVWEVERKVFALLQRLAQPAEAKYSKFFTPSVSHWITTTDFNCRT